MTTGVPHGSIIGPLSYANDITKSSTPLILFYILNSILESLGDSADEIQLSILNELQKVC